LLARLITLLTSLVLLYGALTVLIDLSPGTGHFVGTGPVFSRVCPDTGGGRSPGGGQTRCTFVPANARIPQRVAIGALVIVAASLLLATASRIDRERPALA
jgi:hypothetical protein